VVRNLYNLEIKYFKIIRDFRWPRRRSIIYWHRTI